MKPAAALEVSIDLLEEIASYAYDPLGFVMFAFPWGEKGTELEKFTGPEKWQRELLTKLGKRLISFDDAIQLATTSGHGVGKSALVAWLIWWSVSTFEDTIGIVTANTENQLKTKTWVQVNKWYQLFIGKQFFDVTQTGIFSSDPEHRSTWRIDMVPWSERNTEAFAGLHNLGKRILVLFDEASAIPDLIYEVTEGALTDDGTEIIWAVFGNPTKNSGRFKECFSGGKFAHRWDSRAVDSREVSFTDKKQIARWEQDYGEDSDFFRVRVKGVFPRVDASSFIPLDLAREAANRPDAIDYGEAVVLGVDVGRFGDDPSVIYPRQGRDGRSRQPEIYFGIDTMALTHRIIQACERYRPVAIFIDGGGVGGGVVDNCRRMIFGILIIEVQFGSSASNNNMQNPEARYANKRAEMYGAIRDWLKTGSIPQDVQGFDLTIELASPNYSFNKKEEILLESKLDMRRRGSPSPNLADALACTFAEAIFTLAPDPLGRNKPATQADDYNPYTREAIHVLS